MINWKDIHEDFSKYDSYYQKQWEKLGITYKEAQEWIQIGFEPQDYDKVKKWKNKNFNSRATKEWIAVGFRVDEAERAKQWKDQGFASDWIAIGLNSQEINFANYLKQNNYQPAQLSIADNLFQLRKAFYPGYPSVQTWLNENYPWLKKKTTRELNLRNLSLEGDLDLEGFSSSWESPLKVYISGNPNLGEIKNDPKHARIFYKDVQEHLNKYSDKNQVEWIDLQSSYLYFEQPGELVIDGYPELKKIYGERISNINKVTISNCLQLEEVNIEKFWSNQELILHNLPNLKKLIYWDSKLTTLDLTNLPNLQKINCSYNLLTEIKLPINAGEKLEELNLDYNNFPKQDLSFLSHLVNLKKLWLKNNISETNISYNRIKEKVKKQGIYNRFKGSLEPLKNLNELKTLYIGDTDIDSGLEYLPESVEYFGCAVGLRKDAKVKTIEKELKKHDKFFKLDSHDTLIRKWREANPEKIKQVKLDIDTKQANKKPGQEIITSISRTSSQSTISSRLGNERIKQPGSEVVASNSQNKDLPTIPNELKKGPWEKPTNKLQTYEELQQKNQALQNQIQQKQQTISDQQNQIKQFQEQNQDLNELFVALLPNTLYNFTTLKQEIIRLKCQELVSQVRGKKKKLEQLVTETKNKASNSEKIIDLLLEVQKQIIQEATEVSQKVKLNGKLEAYQNILEDNLTKEELQNLLDKQKEVLELEKHLENLQQNQQQAQILQKEPFPSSSKPK